MRLPRISFAVAQARYESPDDEIECPACVWERGEHLEDCEGAPAPPDPPCEDCGGAWQVGHECPEVES